MYRIGGQNGLLDQVRLEGQPEIPPADPFVPRPYDTVTRRGEDFIGPSERTEFVIVTKDRNGDYLEPGDSMFIWTIDFPHGMFTPFYDNTIGDGDVNNRDIQARKLVRIEILSASIFSPFDIAEGDPLLAHPLVDRPVEDIKDDPTNALSAVPAVNDPFLGTPFEGTEDRNIMVDNRVALPFFPLLSS